MTKSCKYCLENEPLPSKRPEKKTKNRRKVSELYIEVFGLQKGMF